MRTLHPFTDSTYTGGARSADGCLLESIVSPNAFVVPGFQPDIVPQNYGQFLLPRELANIIAYLNTWLWRRMW